MWSAAILAGGRGRRLGGRVKPLLDVAGRTILGRQRDLFAALGVVPRLVAPDATPFAGCGLEVVADLGDAGALGGLHTALATAPTDAVVVVAGDLPFLTAAFVEAVLVRLDGHEAAVPRTADGRWHPLAAAYRRGAAARLATAIARGERRVTDTITALDVAELDAAALAALDDDGTLLLNVNTPEDYERARRLAITCPAPPG